MPKSKGGYRKVNEWAAKKGVIHSKVGPQTIIELASENLMKKGTHSISDVAKSAMKVRSAEGKLFEAIFGGAANRRLRTPMEKMELVRAGVGKIELISLKDRAGLDYDELATVLPATRATLISKKGKEKFSAPVSDAIVSLADIYSYGYEVFGDEKRFNTWMHQPLAAINGKSPFSLLDNQFGREEVRNLIGRIEYGVYS